MTRTDLLALTADALAALSNRGLVKRAAKDLDAGTVPEVSLEPDGTVRCVFPGEVMAALPAGGGLEGATCTCAATGVCRHQVGLILAYQRHAAQEPDTGDTVSTAGPTAATRMADSAAAGGAVSAVVGAAATGAPATGAVPPAVAGDARQPAEPTFTASPGPVGAPPAGWSPAAFDDDTLARTLGERALTMARRTRKAGYSARIRRPTVVDPAASVELPTCTVRFLVPGELGYVHTDAAAALRGEVIALAVWAFRAADERGLDGDDVRIDVGGGGDGVAGSGLEAALNLVDQLLLEGAMHAGPVLTTALRPAGRELAVAGLHWPAAAMEDIAGQLTAYRDRAAQHRPEHLAALLAEMHARHRSALHDGGITRSQVLGTSEAAETPLRQVRLTALGCRVDGTDVERTADVFLAHGETGVVLVLKRRWEAAAGEALTGAGLAGRRIAGTSLRSLATANVVSENASRSAGRVVRLTQGRLSRTTVTPLGAAWESLPGSLLVRDLGALDRAMAALPPRVVRPRVEAELVRVIAVSTVENVGYHAGDQRLEATITDASGMPATVSAAYSPYRPAALDCLAEALNGAGRLSISGAVRRARGGLVVDPIAVMTDGAVTVPDLAPGDGDGALHASSSQPDDPLGAALDDAVVACAQVAHRGLRHVTDGMRARIGEAARVLRERGLRATAGQLDDLVTACRGDEPARRIEAWVDTQLRLMTTTELR